MLQGWLPWIDGFSISAGLVQTSLYVLVVSSEKLLSSNEMIIDIMVVAKPAVMHT
jgi:hypothetical protein